MIKYTLFAAAAVLAGCASQTGAAKIAAAPASPVKVALAAEPAASAAAGLAAAAPPAAYEICAVCHTVSDDGADGMGPNLRGVVGRKAGAKEGFGYSDALKNSNITWTPAEIDSWLTDPGAKVPGTQMYQGVADPAERKAIISYLQTLK